jgi:acetyl-CoA acetyltransferase
MAANDVVIVGYAELPNQLRANRSVYDLAGEAFAGLLDATGIGKDAIDGFCTTASLTEGKHLFHGAELAEVLGLSLDWFLMTSIGGASVLSGVAAAASALREGQCELAVVVSADAPTTALNLEYGAYHPEFQDTAGIVRPPEAFGLLMRAYEAVHGLDARALGKIAVTFRQGAMVNDNALPKLRRALTLDDYLSARMIAEPLRLLDSVMFCDGGNAVMMTTERHARSLGVGKMVRIASYAERTGHLSAQAMPDILDTGFSVAGPKALARAGLTHDRLSMLQAYDDFTIAVMMQLEQIGFCGPSEGAEYILANDFSPTGRLPLNTGGGQLSAGQPGLASGGLILVEAIRQLFNEAGDRQIPSPSNAMVTGIGAIPYARNWLMSNVMILEA